MDNDNVSKRVTGVSHMEAVTISGRDGWWCNGRSSFEHVVVVGNRPLPWGRLPGYGVRILGLENIDNGAPVLCVLRPAESWSEVPLRVVPG